jgi:WD40 repeat protein
MRKIYFKSQIFSLILLKPDYDSLAIGFNHPVIHIWNLSANLSARQLNGHTNKVTSLLQLNDNMTIASGSFDCTIKIWSLKIGIML